MKPRPRQPRLFIGSSTEGLPIAYGIQENLEFDAETTVWKQGIFHPTRQTLADLVAAMQGTDFAVFVFNPDDVLMMRGKKFEATRDNDEDGQATAAFERICTFLNALADTVIGNSVLENTARPQFETVLRSVWRLAASYFVNSAHESQDEYWEERSFPPMKLLADRWSVAP